MIRRSSLVSLLIVGAVGIIGSLTPSAQTAPAPEDVAAGMRIYRQKADCQACHGGAADGPVRSYGMKQADLQKLGSTMPDPAATLQPREIEQVADFLFAKVVGKGPMNHAACVEYFGSDVETCKEFPNSFRV